MYCSVTVVSQILLLLHCLAAEKRFLLLDRFFVRRRGATATLFLTPPLPPLLRCRHCFPPQNCCRPHHRCLRRHRRRWRHGQRPLRTQPAVQWTSIACPPPPPLPSHRPGGRVRSAPITRTPAPPAASHSCVRSPSPALMRLGLLRRRRHPRASSRQVPRLEWRRRGLQPARLVSIAFPRRGLRPLLRRQRCRQPTRSRLGAAVSQAPSLPPCPRPWLPCPSPQGPA